MGYSNHPQISFLIVNWNGLPVLEECLKSIERTCHDVEYEVLLSDNKSDDGSVSFVRQNFPQVIIFQNKKNLFFATPTNNMAKNAKGDFFMLLNNDIILKEGAILTLLKTLQESEQIGAVVPQLLYPDGTIQPSCRRFPTLFSLTMAGLGLDKIFPQKSWKMKDWGHREPRFVKQPMMSAMLIKRDCWSDVGELDAEQFPLYFNDVDWCKRAFSRGWKIKFEPSARAIHLEAWSGKKLGFKQAYFSSKGMYNYFRKHHVHTVFSPKWFVLVVLILSFLGLKGFAFGSQLIKERIKKKLSAQETLQ